jgi:acid phosphatase family membrane protein YuiD
MAEKQENFMQNALKAIGHVLMTIITNKIFYTTFTAWFIAQAMKIIIHLVRTGKIDFRLLVGTGGMPSSHTASVTSLTMCIGLVTGWNSPVFMVSLGYCIVVCSDAMGVRRAAGRQARVLNIMMDEMGSNKLQTEKRLKELLGHTPLEAAAGIILGILIPIIFF